MRMAPARLGLAGCVVGRMWRLTPPWAEPASVPSEGLVRSLISAPKEFRGSSGYLALSSDSDKGPDTRPPSKSPPMNFVTLPLYIRHSYSYLKTAAGRRRLVRHSDRFRTPLRRKFCVITFNRSLGRVISEVEISLLRISNKETLMVFQNGLRIRRTGSTIPGERRPNPSLNCLRFVPPSTHISPSQLCVIEKSITDGDATVSRLRPPPSPFLPF